jgi:hypothetical protein
LYRASGAPQAPLTAASRKRLVRRLEFAWTTAKRLSIGYFVMVNFFTPEDCVPYNYPFQSEWSYLFIGQTSDKEPRHLDLKLSHSTNDLFAFEVDIHLFCKNVVFLKFYFVVASIVLSLLRTNLTLSDKDLCLISFHQEV